MQIGAPWGVSHTITVMTVGSAIVLFGVVIPPWLGPVDGISRRTDACPAWRAHSARHEPRRGRGPGGTVHGHGDYVHRHPHGHGPDDHDHAVDRTPWALLDRSWLGGLPLYQLLRPFAVGLVHGLAGSAASALIVLTIIRDPILAAAYLLLFGIGTIGGVILITLLLTAPFVFTSVNLPRFNRQLAVASGLISFVFGLFLIYDIGFADGVCSPTIRMGNHTDR